MFGKLCLTTKIKYMKGEELAGLMRAIERK